MEIQELRRESASRINGYLLLAVLAVLVGAGLVFYSQTMAFAWDEGFHLLAAQLIVRGRRPYLDFIFPQTPLNAYWNAGWMALLGETWRVPHAIAAIAATGAVFLTADYLWRRFPILQWRPAAALLGALAVGLNTQVVLFGTIAQAYGFCLLLLVTAFRVSVLAVERENLLLPCLAGFFSGAAADSSLLTASAVPVLLAWMLVYQRPGRRIATIAAFVAGAIAAFAPLLRLLVQAPRNVIFGVLEYNLLHRGLNWEGATEHNVGVMLAWIDSSHALLLAVLAVAGLVFVRFRSDWTRAQRGEFYLCLFLALSLALFISTAHPTFERYYLFLVPFLAIPGAAGLYWIASRFDAEERPFRPVLAVVVLLALGLGKALYTGRDDLTWNGVDHVVQLVEQVTPKNAPLLADEQVYFLTRRIPPEGMELDDSHKLQLPEPLARRLHVVSEAELDRRLRSGEFATVEVQGDEDWIKKHELARLYRQQKNFEEEGWSVFWDRAPSGNR